MTFSTARVLGFTAAILAGPVAEGISLPVDPGSLFLYIACGLVLLRAVWEVGRRL